MPTKPRRNRLFKHLAVYATELRAPEITKSTKYNNKDIMRLSTYMLKTIYINPQQRLIMKEFLKRSVLQAEVSKTLIGKTHWSDLMQSLYLVRMNSIGYHTSIMSRNNMFLLLIE